MKIPTHNGGMRKGEYQYIRQIIWSRTPCNLLVFGVGNDSNFWHESNPKGKTVFLEDYSLWEKKIRKQNPDLIICHVEYNTLVRNASKLLKAYRGGDKKCLHMKLPNKVKNKKWDVIIVDGPRGNSSRYPGRMKSIYMASILAAPDADIFLHDVHRRVEKQYSREFLGKRYDGVIGLERFNKEKSCQTSD